MQVFLVVYLLVFQLLEIYSVIWMHAGIPTPRNILWIHAGIPTGIPTPRNIGIYSGYMRVFLLVFLLCR